MTPQERPVAGDGPPRKCLVTGDPVTLCAHRGLHDALEAAEVEGTLRPYGRWCPVCESWFVTKESCIHPQAVMLYERTGGGRG